MSVRVVIVGAGSLGQELARRLGGRHEVVLIENVKEGLSIGGGPMFVRSDENPPGGVPPTVVTGDGTSRLVLSKQLELHGATVLVATAGSDEVNTELGRLGRELGFDPVIAVLHDPKNRERYSREDITILDRSSIIAERVERTLEFKGQVVPCGIGLGIGEIVEILLTGTSPLLKRALKDLAPDRWRIAAVFRENELLVPTGETVLSEGERVLLVGQPSALRSVAQFLRLGTPEFPAQFGNGVLTLEFAGPEERVAREARYLAAETGVAKLLRCVHGGERIQRPPSPGGRDCSRRSWR